jgi:hypothetical protein
MHRILLIALTLAATSTAAQTRPGARPTDRIAADLGIPEATFISCFSNVHPDPGHNPTGARQQANKAVLLPCLQAANPEITNDRLDAVMDRYRPEGPMR